MVQAKPVKNKNRNKTANALRRVLTGVAAALAGMMVYSHSDGAALLTAMPGVFMPPKAGVSNSAGLSSVRFLGGAGLIAVQGAGINNTRGETAEAKNAVTLKLHKSKPEDNACFTAKNFFPGDRQTRCYCIKVSHQNAVSVRFRADIRQGCEKLAEALKCRVKLLSTGQTMYDGLMREMPNPLIHTLGARKGGESEVYYQITAYLDTGVGNDYQGRELTADFVWWVEETEDLKPSSATGENYYPVLAGIAAAVFVLGILAACRRRKGGRIKDED